MYVCVALAVAFCFYLLFFALAAPLTLARTYLSLVYPAFYAVFSMFFILSPPPHPHCTPGIFPGMQCGGEGVPGRREPDTEPSGVVGGRGKPL